MISSAVCPCNVTGSNLVIDVNCLVLARDDIPSLSVKLFASLIILSFNVKLPNFLSVLAFNTASLLLLASPSSRPSVLTGGSLL